jgi:hypothetical protein
MSSHKISKRMILRTFHLPIDGYLPDSGYPNILRLQKSGFAEHLTRDLYGAGSMATACSSNR